MKNCVLKVENLYKEYKLGLINHGTLTHDLQSWWARFRGKEDPNSIISQHHNKDIEKESFLALKNVNFEVKEGERVGVIGKNGAGKSTLLKILSRITMPSKGLVKIKGRVGSLLEVGTGFHPELTGRENIYLNGAILGMTRREIYKNFDAIVDFSGIEKYIDTPVKRYSSGMSVRLAFAVAAYLEPEILIVDEVLAVGDAEFQKKALGKMEDVSLNEGRTVIFVSHNMSVIQKLCNRGILFESGEIISDGKIDIVVNDYIKRIGILKTDRIHELRGVKVISFRHYPEKGKKKYSSDSKLFAEIDFFTEENIKTAYLNFVIEDHEGKFLIHSRTDFYGLYPSFETGMYRVRVEVPRIGLKAGTYSIWFRIYVKNKDKVDFADSEKLPLLIEGSFEGGLLNIPIKWNWDKI